MPWLRASLPRLWCAGVLIAGPMRVAALAVPAAAAPAAVADAASAGAAQILAEPPSDLAVTVYRAPSRNSGSIDLDDLDGFALVSETRIVRLPAGESRLRFEGVADGIEPASAIVTGLAAGVIEKNRDAELLSPSALIAAAVGRPVELLRVDRKTGKTEHLPGTILSDADGGVVFQTAQGIEALRCSGLAETFGFTRDNGLSALPTLSVLVQSAHAETRRVTLSYLARGFDWAADYTATLAADGKSLDLGAWVTLANSNGVGFPRAQAQVVAGRVNREDGEVQPIELGEPILAQCWPRGSTSDSPALLRIHREAGKGMLEVAAMSGIQETVVTGMKKVIQEQLGDLKLYRVPERTTFASRQSKQVRLMDTSGVPVATLYGAEVDADENADWAPAYRVLRTMNTKGNHLGLPLPSGKITVFGLHEGRLLLEQEEGGIRDIAVGEELEIYIGWNSDVQFSVTREKTGIDSAPSKMLPLLPGVSLQSVKVSDVSSVKISNARDSAIDFELQLKVYAGEQVARADHPLSAKNGRPMFKLKIPANATTTVRYQTTYTVDHVTPQR